jgi:hypothetical protein
MVDWRQWFVEPGAQSDVGQGRRLSTRNCWARTQENLEVRAAAIERAALLPR